MALKIVIINPAFIRTDIKNIVYIRTTCCLFLGMLCSSGEAEVACQGTQEGAPDSSQEHDVA